MHIAALCAIRIDLAALTVPDVAAIGLGRADARGRLIQLGQHPAIQDALLAAAWALLRDLLEAWALLSVDGSPSVATEGLGLFIYPLLSRIGFVHSVEWIITWTCLPICEGFIFWSESFLEIRINYLT